MFGSLRKKLEEVSAQVNMFDGGKTAATVRANRNQAPPAQTIRSQPKQNSLVGRNDNQPGFQITNNSFTRGLSRGFDQANMFDNNRTWQQRTPTGTQSIGQEAKRIVNTPTTPKKYWDNGVGKAVNTAIAGTNRAAAGIGQDLGGLVDYVTPGKGTNRVTSYFRDRGAMWDDKAKEAGVDGLGYKVSQVPLNVASYMVPGSVAKGVGSIPRVASTGAKVANIASKTPGVSSVLSAGAKLSTKLDDIAKTGNIAQRTGARLASSYMSKPAMADVAFDTIQSAGNRTSKGQDNSFGTLAVDTGLSLATQGGVNLAGQALKPVTTRLVQTAKNLPSPAQVTTRLAGASRKIDETLFTPRLNRLDLDTRDALIAYSDRLVGADPYITGKVESDLIKKVRAIGDANGVDLTNGTVVQQLDRIEALLNGYKGSSGALNSKPVPVDPLEALKQEAKRFGYDKGYTEEGQIANTIDELMKEQNAVREVGIPLYDKYKSKLDGTKTVTEMMTPAELKAYRAAEAKSEKASKLLKDYFDYKKGNNQAQKEAAVPKTNKTNLVLKERKLPGGKDGPIEALKAEARKYKSAEEFVKAQLNAAPGNDLETLSTISRPIPISQLPSSELGLKGRTVSSWESRIKSGQRPVVELNFEGVGVKVRDGNHRLQAYKNLGFTEVPAVTKRQLTDLYDQAHSQPTPKAEAPDPLESLKQEARKEYDFFSNSKYFADNDNVIKTLAELNDKSTPTYQALDLLRQERGLGGVEKNLIDISKRTDATNKQTAQAKQVAKKDLDGFTDDKSSLQRGKIEKTLDSQIRYNGEVMTKRDYIRKLIDEGYVPDEKTGSIYSPNDRSNYQAVTKTEADYARHLYNQATAPKTEGVAPQPTKGGGVEVNGSNWREAVDNQKFGKDADTNANILGEKQRTLRAVAEVSRSDKELGDILNRAEQLHKEGYLGDNANLAWDIMQNPASSKATKARATKLYKDITKPALAPKVEVPTGFSKSLEDAGFSTPQSRVGRNKVQAGSQARTPNQLKSANKGQSFESSESLASYPEGKPKKAQPETVEAKQSPKQSDLSSSRSSDNIIDLESIDVNDPFGNRSLTQKVKNEFNRMFIDEDAEMISLLRKVEKETGSKDMVEKWLQDTDMVRGSNSIANSKIRSNENLKGAIHGLSKKEVKQLDEYASARSELYNLENGLSASKSKEKLQSIINKHEAKYGKRFESLNNYYNDLAKDLHEAGIISKEQMDTWAKNKDYVRVQRDMEDLLEPSVGKSRSRSFGSTSTSKKRTGSKRDILSPTETAFKRTQEIQLEIQRNKAASNIIDVLEKHGLSERIPQSQAHGKNVIKRFKDGKVEYFATNKDIKRVIENVRPFELGVIAKVVSFPTRVFKAGTTGLSAPFAVTNYARDQVGSAIYSKSVMATHNPKNIVSGIYQGVKDFGGVGNSDIWEKFVKHAGDQTSFDMTRGTLGSKSIMNEVRRGSLKQRGITLVDPRYLVRNVEDLISITEKSTRYQNFKGIYEKAIKEGLGEDVAIQKATQAALQNSVNFGRAGSVAKAANLILPYFNAGIQGSRNLGRSFRDRPVATAAKSVGFVGIPMVALTLHNYSDPETREIYSNIDETEKQDNFIIVLPGAKQRDDGTYEGILKIPKPQGYRELLDPLRSYAESFASGEDPKDVASMLKDMLPAISGPIQTEDTGKLISSLTPQALKPALQAHLNKDLYWGNDVVPDYMIAGTDDPTERARKNTSGMARFIANRLNVSPIAVEKFIIDSTGSLGRYGINAVDSELARRDIIPDEQIGGRSISSDFKRRTTEARGIENKNMTDGQRYFRDREEVTKSLKPQQKTAWESYNQSNKNFKGEVVFDKSSFAQKQAKASAYVQFPELFETDKKLDKKARDRGEPGNPLYDLNYKQAIKVVLKKALPPGSKDSELDALYNQPWYADFKAKESQYYDKIFAGKEKEDSGYPQRSPELQKKIDYYYTLPKGTGQRSDFLKSNPDVIQHWDAVEAWTNGERAKIGLDPTTKDDSFGFGSGGGRGGRRGRSKAGYDYTKALFDANVGSVSMTKDLQSILEKYMKANAKISKKA